MLAREVVQEFGQRARFVVEDFGASPLAARFGIDEYPAVFVDDALVARPEDFYAWGGAGDGKYLPWSELAQRQQFQDDLRRLLTLRLSGEEVASTSTEVAPRPRRLPDLRLTDIAGSSFSFAELEGKPVLLEIWATWCPPCLHTLDWLGRLDPAAANVVAVAVESEMAEVTRLTERSAIPGRVVMATPDLLQALGGVSAIPTLIVADGRGNVVRTFYGAPPDLHERVAAELEKVAAGATGAGFESAAASREQR